MKNHPPDIYSEKIEPIDLKKRFKDDCPSDEALLAQLTKIDFYEFDYITRIGNVYWSGILTAEPFDRIIGKYSEEEILNIFKDYHIDITDGVMTFKHNTKSPLHRFLMKFKDDGYGWNVPTSIGGCFSKIADQLLLGEYDEK